MHAHFHRTLAKNLLTYLTDYRAQGADNLLLHSVSFDVAGVVIEDQPLDAYWSCVANLGTAVFERRGSFPEAIAPVTRQQQRRPARRPIVSGAVLIGRDAFGESEPAAAAYVAAAVATDDTVHAIRWDPASQTPDQRSGAADTIGVLDTATFDALGDLLKAVRSKR